MNEQRTKLIEEKFANKFGEDSFLELREFDEETAVFDYPNYWEDYPQFQDKIGKEVSFLLKEFNKTKQEFEKPFFFHVGGYVIDHLNN